MCKHVYKFITEMAFSMKANMGLGATVPANRQSRITWQNFASKEVNQNAVSISIC